MVFLFVTIEAVVFVAFAEAALAPTE